MSVADAVLEAAGWALELAAEFIGGERRDEPEATTDGDHPRHVPTADYHERPVNEGRELNR